jgi:hypothetical protein
MTGQKKKDRNMEYENSKRGTILLRFESHCPHSSLIHPSHFFFHAVSLFNFITFACFLSLSKAYFVEAQMFSTIGMCSVHWANGQFFSSSKHPTPLL